jgi:hypothetical protein
MGDPRLAAIARHRPLGTGGSLSESERDSSSMLLLVEKEGDDAPGD